MRGLAKILVYMAAVLYKYLSYDVTVFQWITSCHKNRMTTRVITLWRVLVTSLTTSVFFFLKYCPF